MLNQTFKLSEVAHAVNEGVSTIQSWADKKWIELPNPGQGKARELSVLDAYAVALTAGIRQTGVPVSTAGRIARNLILSPESANRARQRVFVDHHITEEEFYRENPTSEVVAPLAPADLDEALKNRDAGNPHIVMVEIGKSPWGEGVGVNPSMRWNISTFHSSKDRLDKSHGFGIFFNITDILIFTDNMLGIPYSV